MRPSRRVRLFLNPLEDRLAPAAPTTPVIIEPFAENQITGTFDINIQTDPGQYFDADGHAWQATDWKIIDTSTSGVVWQLPFTSSPPLTFYRVDFSDGAFVGSLAGKTELNYNTNYQLQVRYRDSNSEVSATALRNFRTAGATQPVPGAGTWLVRPGFVVEPVQTNLRLPVNVAFVPNAGSNPSDPLYYINELYGSIRVVRRDGTMSTFATGLLDYNPTGPISGTGEQGLTGLAVERDSVNPNIYNLYVGMLWDNGSPAGPPNHYPKVEKIVSMVGGLTMNTRTVLLNMQPETQGQSHIISNISIGPDNKLYVHMGDGFDSATALNLDMYRGKVLRMNKDGNPVATGDPAGANPFYNAANGINARDYVYTSGHRNPFGGSWRPSNGKHWVVENGNSLDRMVDLTLGSSYGWAGNDATHIQFSKFIWDPATAPVNIDFVDSTRFGGSMFPASAYDHAFVSLSGSTYSAGPLQRSKGIVEFADMTTLGGDGKLLVQPSFLVKYNGTGRATVAGLASGPDGLYFTDLYEDTGVNGATAPGANLYRVRYVGDAGGLIPTIATPAAANPTPILVGPTTQLTVLGADDGGEPALTYTWGVQGSPAGPVAFTVNGTNAAKATTATFIANGTYNFYVAIRDVGGQTAISNVTVVVTSLPSDIGNGLSGLYWDTINFSGASTPRLDSTINFNFGTGAPITGFGTNTFSIRWTGFVQARFTETYTFATTSDDGARLWVNNLTTPLIDAFFDQSATQSYVGQINLVAGQIYAIRMDYYENTGNASVKLEWSSPSQVLEVVPQGRLFSVAPTLPAAPTSLQLSSPNSGQINLTWADASNNEAGFKIERSIDGTNFSLIATVQAGVVAYSNSGLSAGTLYYYRVRATNPAGDSGFTAANRPTRPGPVLGLNTVAGNAQVQLNWVPTFGAATYRVYRGTTPGGQGMTPLISGLTNPNYLDSAVTNGTPYYYKVTAVNVGGEGAASEETVSTPLATNPPSVSQLAVNGGETQRSRVTIVVVNFSTTVTAGSGAFTLTDSGNQAIPNVTLVVNLATVSNATVATITFSGSAVIGGSLPDGRYRFTVVASQVTNTAAPNSLMTANVVSTFHRYFGDFTGNEIVDNTEFLNFRSTLNVPNNQPGYLAAFDFDGDGDVDNNDFLRFRQRLNVPLP